MKKMIDWVYKQFTIWYNSMVNASVDEIENEQKMLQMVSPHRLSCSLVSQLVPHFHQQVSKVVGPITSHPQSPECITRTFVHDHSALCEQQY